MPVDIVVECRIPSREIFSYTTFHSPQNILNVQPIQTVIVSFQKGRSVKSSLAWPNIFFTWKIKSIEKVKRYLIYFNIRCRYGHGHRGNVLSDVTEYYRIQLCHFKLKTRWIRNLWYFKTLWNYTKMINRSALHCSTPERKRMLIRVFECIRIYQWWYKFVFHTRSRWDNDTKYLY